MLLEKVVTIYLDTLLVKEYSIETRRAYGRDLRRFHQFMVDRHHTPISIENIALEDLESYALYLKVNRQLQPRSRNRYISSVSACLAYAVKKEWIPRNPAIWLDAAKVTNRPKAVCTEDELHALIREIEHPIIRTAVELMSKTGLRCGEAINLKMEDVDLDLNKIHVIAGKGGKYRAVPIASSLHPVLVQYRQHVRIAHSPYFFATQKTGRLSTQYINRTLQEVTERLGWSKKITNHTLRRSFATNLYKRGVGIETIKNLLGHESLRTTSIYLQLEEDDLRRAVDLL